MKNISVCCLICSRSVDMWVYSDCQSGIIIFQPNLPPTASQKKTVVVLCSFCANLTLCWHDCFHLYIISHSLICKVSSFSASLIAAYVKLIWNHDARANSSATIPVSKTSTVFSTEWRDLLSAFFPVFFIWKGSHKDISHPSFNQIIYSEYTTHFHNTD